MASWLIVCLVVACAGATMLVAIAKVSRELPPTRRALGEFRTGLQPALVRVRHEAAVVRARREQ